MKLTTNDIARFWSKVDRSTGRDGCWLWQGSTDADGYGRMALNDRPELTHRIAFFLAVGTLPEAVCHECDVPGCCNPEHLWPGNRLLNNRDCIAKGRANKARGEQAGKSKFTAQQVTEIRARSETESIRSLAREFGVHHKSISKIVRRESWDHV